MDLAAGGSTGLMTIAGNDILLYSDVLIDPDGPVGDDPFLAASSDGLSGNVVFGIEDITGDIVFAIYMHENVINSSETQLQFTMVTFEAIDHGAGGDPDNSLDLNDFLSLSVA